jgi:hypothetical protein
MACDEVLDGKQCWGTAPDDHEAHWVGETRWPNEAFVAPSPRTADPRRAMRDIVSGIPVEERSVLRPFDPDILSGAEREKYKIDWLRRALPVFRQVCLAQEIMRTTDVWAYLEWPGKANGRWMSEVTVHALGSGWIEPMRNARGRPEGERVGTEAVTLDGHSVDQNKIVPLYRSKIWVAEG